MLTFHTEDWLSVYHTVKLAKGEVKVCDCVIEYIITQHLTSDNTLTTPHYTTAIPLQYNNMIQEY